MSDELRESLRSPAELAARSGASGGRKGKPRSEPPRTPSPPPPAAGIRLAYLLLHFPGTFPFPQPQERRSPGGRRGRSRVRSARLGPAPPAAARAPLQRTAPPRSPRYNRFPYIGHHSAFLVTGLTGSKLNLVNSTDTIRVRVPEVCLAQRGEGVQKGEHFTCSSLAPM